MGGELMPTERLKQFYQKLPIIRELRAINHSLGVIAEAASVTAAVDAVRFFDVELKNHPRYGSRKRLTAFERKINSQNGEDGIIQEIFNRIGLTNKFFVEVGVADGKECNTSYLLSQGWKGCWIDGRANFVPVIEGRAEIKERLKTLQSFVTRENIASLFSQLNVPNEFDLLSLDIDQNTYYAWEGLKTFRPRVVVTEFNSVVPPNLEWKVAYDSKRVWDGTNSYGASLKSFELLARSFGYSLVGCDFNGVNAFFVRDDQLGDHFEGPYTAENHYEPPRFTLAQFKRGHVPTILDHYAG
jgi:hypothetical protein